MQPRRPDLPPGATVADLPPGGGARRYLVRAADVVLVVLAGSAWAAVGAAVPGERPAGSVVICPRGTPWSLAAGKGGARVVVVAFPGGAQEAVGVLLREPGLDDAALVALAADGGVELVLAPATGPAVRRWAPL